MLEILVSIPKSMVLDPEKYEIRTENLGFHPVFLRKMARICRTALKNERTMSIISHVFFIQNLFSGLSWIATLSHHKLLNQAILSAHGILQLGEAIGKLNLCSNQVWVSRGKVAYRQGLWAARHGHLKGQQMKFTFFQQIIQGSHTGSP